LLILLPEAKSAQDEHHDHDKADEIDDAVHAVLLARCDDAGSERQLIVWGARSVRARSGYASVQTLWVWAARSYGATSCANCMWLSVFGRQPIKLHVLEAPNPRIVDCPWTRGRSSNPTGGTLSHVSALAQAIWDAARGNLVRIGSLNARSLNSFDDIACALTRRPEPAFSDRVSRAVPDTYSTRKDPAMGLFTKDIKTFDDLFLHTLQDIYYAENQIVKSLPEMIDNASSAQLKQGLTNHLGETKTHVKRLEQVFQMLGQSARGVDCPAIDGIIEEAEEVTGEVDDKEVLDAAIIAAGQAVEHYEITRYGSLIAWAKRLGRADVAQVLEQTLAEEKMADKKLTSIAESQVNQQAAV